MPTGLRKKKFKLEVKLRQRELRKSIREAERALKAGQAALKRVSTTGDRQAMEANRLWLRDNRWVLLNLKSAYDCLDDVCVDQFLNSDPIYRG